MVVTDTQYRELAAYAPGGTLNQCIVRNCRSFNLNGGGVYAGTLNSCVLERNSAVQVVAAEPEEVSIGYTHIVPARYFLVALRAIVLKGAGAMAFWQDLAALAIFATVATFLASMRLRRASSSNPRRWQALSEATSPCPAVRPTRSTV